MRLIAAVLAAFVMVLPSLAQGEELAWRHGHSLMGDLKYPPDFKHFDYVNPDAPKGGLLRFGVIGTFDSLNFVPPKGVAAAGLGLVYQQLFVASLDEASSKYGSVADAVKYPADFSFVTYRLRAGARWDDGVPLTADDVVFSFEQLRLKNPFYAQYYKNVVKVTANGEREVTFVFDKPGNRELPLVLGELLIVPKHWWTAKGADGKPRDLGETTLEIPLGSGPYRIANVNPGVSITYERVKDFWAADIPTEIGTNNFDEIRYTYYQDQAVLLEGFKGDRYDVRFENIARNWAQAYDFPAVAQGRVVREEIPDTASGRMQAFGFNLRRETFQDPRVRRAFNLAMDFEEMNRTLFFGAYTRIDSYFAGTELASSGLPEGRELEILNEIKDKIPPSVFTTPYANPVGGEEAKRRANLREAFALLKEAGWEIKDQRLTNLKTGKPMVVEFLLDGPTFEKVVLNYRQGLERLGITVKISTVDSSQNEERERNHDFDILVFSALQSLSPGNEQREFWGSAAADVKGSRNLLGIKDPAIDALIDKVIFAKDRAELIAATHALDRVLLAGNYVVPQWRSAVTRMVRWDRFSHPAMLPKFSANGGFPDIWWYDAAKATKTGAAQ